MLNDLNYPFNYQWHVEEDVAVIGWSYDSHGSVIQGSKLASVFKGINNKDEFSNALIGLNGHFSVVLQNASYTAAAVDHIRSFPLLYRYGSGELKIYSDTQGIEFDVDPAMEKFFIQSWCTPGNSTLDPNVFQLLPGQYLWLDSQTEINGMLSPAFYYHHIIQEKSASTRPELELKCLQIIDRVFDRLAGQLENKTIVVPLSGGYDSRLILSMLRSKGLDNILTYTYGRKDSHEVRIARKVAEELKVDWHFVEYDESLFSHFFGDQWRSYSYRNHFLTSLPHEQDFFALYALKELGILPTSFTAVPGYCGDLLGGSITAYEPGSWTIDGLIDFIDTHHYGKQGLPDELQIPFDIYDKTTFYDAYQQYFIENKVSKFIVNAVRVYEHFGGSWLMPFWDRELIDFFYSVPYSYREKQTLYNQVIFEKVFQPLGIDILKPGYDDNYPGRIKERIKSNLPEQIKGVLKNIVRDSSTTDPNALQSLNKMIFERVEKPNAVLPDEINISHAIYFLLNLKK